MRPLVSYEDITTSTPQEPAGRSAAHGPEMPSGSASSNSHPPKRRKTNGKSGGGGAVQHWDDPGGQSTQMSYDDAVVVESTTSTSTYVQQEGETQGDEEEAQQDEEEKDEEEESRDLTHEEVWDDSALVDAWNSAMAEYETFHGPGKSWKDEPIVKKSPLWYNVPPASTSKSKSKGATSKAGPSTQPNGKRKADPDADSDADAEDSAPLNFDTFVPTHDPSLTSHTAAPVPEQDYALWAQSLASSSGQLVDQDEAFQRALTATYWSGYYTAVYQYRRQESLQEVHHEEEDKDEEGEEDEMAYADADEEMIPSQR